MCPTVLRVRTFFSSTLWIVKDDTVNLNHAKIIRQVEDEKLKRGQQIYEASCIQCHGADGNTPSLASARAFGKQKLKFGADPFSMFKTLSQGNGLMAAASALSPHERYEVVAHIRNRFMKGSNPDCLVTLATPLIPILDNLCSPWTEKIRM